MLALEIDNPEIELVFKTKFNGNKNNFINFIQDSLKNLESVNNDELQFKKLDPKKNAYRMTNIDANEELSNPFEKVENVLSYAKSIRERAYR